ncbi:hypothetical protein, partial [Vibrio mediterranei]|uniref:hypothetical protein n=3 Tax=Vibrio TaxID=662 RepID=UPI004067FE48
NTTAEVVTITATHSSGTRTVDATFVAAVVKVYYKEGDAEQGWGDDRSSYYFRTAYAEMSDGTIVTDERKVAKRSGHKITLIQQTFMGLPLDNSDFTLEKAGVSQQTQLIPGKYTSTSLDSVNPDKQHTLSGRPGHRGWIHSTIVEVVEGYYRYEARTGQYTGAWDGLSYRKCDVEVRAEVTHNIHNLESAGALVSRILEYKMTPVPGGGRCPDNKPTIHLTPMWDMVDGWNPTSVADEVHLDMGFGQVPDGKKTFAGLIIAEE